MSDIEQRLTPADQKRPGWRCCVPVCPSKRDTQLRWLSPRPAASCLGDTVLGKKVANQTAQGHARSHQDPVLWSHPETSEQFCKIPTAKVGKPECGWNWGACYVLRQGSYKTRTAAKTKASPGVKVRQNGYLEKSVWWAKKIRIVPSECRLSGHFSLGNLLLERLIMLMLHELLSIIKLPRAFKQQAERKLSKVTNGSMRSGAGQIPEKPAVLWWKLHCTHGINTLQYLQMRENLSKASVSAKCLPLETQEFPLVLGKPIPFQLWSQYCKVLSCNGVNCTAQELLNHISLI